MTALANIRWPGYLTTLAIMCWSAALIVTMALGWSAWSAYDATIKDPVAQTPQLAQSSDTALGSSVSRLLD